VSIAKENNSLCPLLIDHSSSQQVAAIVQCAAENGYPVQAKSGGHSYGNYGEILKLTWPK
jgi:FAD/FMN-containing dehydrogenases